MMLAAFCLLGCLSPQAVVAQKEDQLAAAGFVLRPANTPERQAMLSSLPPHQFLRRIHGDDVTYVYSDPLVCACLYVGTQQDYSRYQFMLQQQRIADQQELTAQAYSNAAWNWGAWGPWGPSWGFGPGAGW